MRLLSNRALGFSTLLAVVAFVPSCGGSGGGGGEGGDRTMQFGPLTTRVAGTVQPPVTSTGYYTAVTGVAGGNITAMTVQDTSPTLAETRIAFTSTRDGNPEIYTMNADGSGQTQITDHFNTDSSPSWSPDGTKIAFLSLRAGNQEIYTMNADGSLETRLTNNPGSDQSPSWSPDGTKVAFVSNRDGNWEIYAMYADGSGQTRLTTNTAIDRDPSWSPDGSQIAFMTNRDGNDDIYTMNANGSGQTRLTSNAADDVEPSWSSDGTKIAFVSYRDGFTEIYAMNADGSVQTRLTNNTSYDYNPRWSPDGTKIAFSSNRDGNNEIYTMNANGSGQTRLTYNAETDSDPSWSPFLARRTIVGAGGSMGVNAAGFLFGLTNSDLPSLVVFDAATRNSARVKAQTGLDGGASPLMFNISADSINRLAFVNFFETHKVTTLVGPGTSVATATDAIIGFDSSNGRVASILPYTSNRSPAPTFSLEKGAQVVRGRFLGAWDGKGVNRAPNGATELRLDAKTGEIVGVK